MPILAMELPGQILQEAVRSFLAELPLSQREKARLLLYDVAKQIL